jgi:hypothetical protein
MIRLKETAGDTLVGAINGVNTVYTTSFDFDPGSVNVYVNGRLKVRTLDDGFTPQAPRTLIMKEALLIGDSLEVEYKSDVATGGGADGGCPSPPQIEIAKPTTESDEYLPALLTEDMDPSLTADELRLSMIAASLKPVIITPEEG